MFRKVNPSSLSGAMDIIVIEHKDGSLRSSPWHLTFGKFGLFYHSNKIISVSVNDSPAPFLMYVDKDGRGQFFASQSTKQTKNNLKQQSSFPTVSLPEVSISPSDVRKILKTPKEGNKNERKSPKKGKTNELEDENFSTFITRNSAVDLEAVFMFDDPDPDPITTTASSLDLAQTISSSKNEELVRGPKMDAPVPSAIILNSLRPLLHHGENRIDFTVSSLLQGPKTIVSYLYLWPYTSKIVISDVDGTVTKSDVLGQVLPSIGKDWTHPGLARLYQTISNQNIQFIYMSSRPIGEANYTRNYLKGIEQDGIKIPSGPLITCPSTLFPAISMELIKKEPHIFKISAIRTIFQLFDSEQSPFVFGFGNKKTDVVAYSANNMIPSDHVFLFNKQHKVLDHEGNLIYTSIDELQSKILDVFKLDHIIN